MSRSIRCLLLPLAVATMTLSGARAAQAHFPWLAVDAEGHAVWFFGETPADRTYKLPPPIEAATIQWLDGQAEPRPVPLSSVSTDTLVGRRSSEPVAKKGMLVAVAPYGIYQGTRLNYAAQHLLSDQAEPSPVEKLPLQVLLRQRDGGLAAQVLWQGNPLSGAEVTLFCDDGHEEGAGQTDAEGRITFTDQEVEPGLGGLLVRHVLEDRSGELEGQKYQSESHYLTVTFVAP
jgi:hypothetical protein